jgi:hypothetical protein
MSVEDIKAEVELNYPRKYVDLYEIDEEDPIDPLAKVVPTVEDNFFGTNALNLLVFTKLYINDDEEWDAQYEDSKARLLATYDKFAKYELHIYIDSAAGDILDANEGQLETFEELLTGLAEELVDYGITYHGQMSSETGELGTSINEVIQTFISDT